MAARLGLVLHWTANGLAVVAVFFGAWLYFEISTPDSALAVYLLLAALGAAGWWPIASTPVAGATRLCSTYRAIALSKMDDK
jgi:hypothetical protein